jgi:hypothetical protein
MDLVGGRFATIPHDGEYGELLVGEVVRSLHVYICKRSAGPLSRIVATGSTLN